MISHTLSIVTVKIKFCYAYFLCPTYFLLLHDRPEINKDTESRSFNINEGKYLPEREQIRPSMSFFLNLFLI